MKTQKKTQYDNELNGYLTQWNDEVKRHREMLLELQTVQVYAFDLNNRQRVIEIRDKIYDLIKLKLQGLCANAWSDKAGVAQALQALISSPQMLHLLSEVAKYSNDPYGQARLTSLQETIADFLLQSLLYFTNCPSARRSFGKFPPFPLPPPSNVSKKIDFSNDVVTKSGTTCYPKQPPSESRLKLTLEDTEEIAEFSVEELTAGMSQMSEMPHDEEQPTQASLNFEQLFTGEEFMTKPHPSEMQKQGKLNTPVTDSSSRTGRLSFKPFPKLNVDKAPSSTSSLPTCSSSPFQAAHRPANCSSISSSSSSSYRSVSELHKFKMPLNTAPKKDFTYQPANSANLFPTNSKPPPSPKFFSNPPNADISISSLHVSRPTDREDSARGGRHGRPRARASSHLNPRSAQMLEPLFGGLHRRGDSNFDRM